MSTPDFFRSRLDQMIDLRHPLAVLYVFTGYATYARRRATHTSKSPEVALVSL